MISVSYLNCIRVRLIGILYNFVFNFFSLQVISNRVIDSFPVLLALRGQGPGPAKLVGNNFMIFILLSAENHFETFYVVVCISIQGRTVPFSFFFHFEKASVFMRTT